MATLCLHCSTETSNPRFCSKSCAAKCNNRTSPKRTATPKLCLRCRTTAVERRKSLCNDCKAARDDDHVTIGQLLYNGPNRYRAIRDRARNKFKYKLTHCERCAYDKHVEVCHIKSIKDFPDDTPISVVNDPNNVVILCPNCHWELDHP